MCVGVAPNGQAKSMKNVYNLVNFCMKWSITPQIAIMLCNYYANTSTNCKRSPRVTVGNGLPELARMSHNQSLCKPFPLGGAWLRSTARRRRNLSARGHSTSPGCLALLSLGVRGASQGLGSVYGGLAEGGLKGGQGMIRYQAS